MAMLPKFNNICPTGKQLQEPNNPPPYSLIRKDGKTMTFYVIQLAELYRSLYGGTLLRH